MMHRSGKEACINRRTPRKGIRISITVRSEEAGMPAPGISIDFSEEGMAFEAQADFSVGERIIVNFINPRDRRRFALSAGVVRRGGGRAGGPSFYGVIFTALTPEDSGALTEFLSSGG